MLDGVEPGLISPNQGELLHVSGSWRKVEVSELLHVLLGEYLERDYVLDPSIQGQLSLDIDEELTRADLMDLVGGIASIFNWSLEERGGVLFFRPGQRVGRLTEAPVLQAMPASKSDSAAVRVRKLRYIAPDQVVTLLGSFASEGAVIAPAGHMIVMADTTRQIARLSRIVSSLDVAPFQNTEIWTYRLAYRSPDDAAQILQTMIPAARMTEGTNPVAVAIAIPGSKRLMIVARDGTVQPQIGAMIREIDRPDYGELRRRYLYRVQNLDPADIYNFLRAAFAEKVETVQPGQTPPVGPEPRIGLHVMPNSDEILINATPYDYAEMLSVLQQVDRAPQQVEIQSIVAEIRLTNRLEFGVEYFLSTENSLGQLELTGQTPLTGLATGSAFFVGADGFAVISALDNESEARVLSQPYVTVQDRATASFQVGGEVPVLRASEGSATQTGGTSAIREEIDYRETGILLTLQPRINESGMVTLTIKQEITNALPTDIQNQPEFTTRTIETTVTVPHGQTVLLGGIISSDLEDSRNRIPVLGRIPVVGAAFGQRQKRNERTELVLAITPTIINEPSQARALYNDFIRSADGVRAALHTAADTLPIGSLRDTEPEVQESAPNVAPQAPLEQQAEPKAKHAPSGREVSEGAPEGDRPTISLLFDPMSAFGRPARPQRWMPGSTITTGTWTPASVTLAGIEPMLDLWELRLR